MNLKKCIRDILRLGRIDIAVFKSLSFLEAKLWKFCVRILTKHLVQCMRQYCPKLSINVKKCEKKISESQFVFTKLLLFIAIYFSYFKNYIIYVS